MRVDAGIGGTEVRKIHQVVREDYTRKIRNDIVAHVTTNMASTAEGGTSD